MALVAATEPDRVRNLVLLHPFAAGVETETVFERGWPPEVVPGLLAAWHRAFDEWGSGDSLENWDAGQATGYNKRLFGMMERCSAPRTAAVAYRDWILKLDFAEIFKSVSVPTRVLGIPLSGMPESVPRYVAEIIPGAEYFSLPPTQLGMSMGEAWVPGFDHVIEVVTGKSRGARLNRFLGTVLFTDVVGSTEVLARVGDAGYREMRAAHERQVRLLVEESGGRVINVVGDGTLSVFDGPSLAIECAQLICTQAHDLGLRVRSGIHTGELEHTGHDVTGLAVHLGARIAAMAAADEVLVSRTVRDLSLGSELASARAVSTSSRASRAGGRSTPSPAPTSPTFSPRRSTQRRTPSTGWRCGWRRGLPACRAEPSPPATPCSVAGPVSAEAQPPAPSASSIATFRPAWGSGASSGSCSAMVSSRRTGSGRRVEATRIPRHATSRSPVAVSNTCTWSGSVVTWIVSPFWCSRRASTRTTMLSGVPPTSLVP